MQDHPDINILLITKNTLLPELISGFNYGIDLFNGDLTSLSEINADIIIYDSFSYGIKPLENKLWEDLIIIILDTYNEKFFITNLIENRNRGYLLIDDFLDELPLAIAQLIEGKSYLTEKLKCDLKPI